MWIHKIRNNFHISTFLNNFFTGKCKKNPALCYRAGFPSLFISFRIQHCAEYAGTESRRGYWSCLLQTIADARIRVRNRSEDMNQTYAYPDTTTYLSSECSIPECGSSVYHSLLHVRNHNTSMARTVFPSSFCFI